MNTASLPEPIRVLCNASKAGLVALLGEKLYGLYLHGASVFPETQGTGDVDLHVILRGELSRAEIAGIRKLHDELAERFPPMGGKLDAHYILLDEARQSVHPVHRLDPSIVDSAWALHRAHMLAGRCVVWHGPAPRDVFPAPTRSELDEALEAELDYVVRHTSLYPGYCIMNLCRLMYSHCTGDVVTSKFASAEWAVSQYPEWRELIRLARQSYLHEPSDDEQAVMRAHVEEFLAFARDVIRQCQSSEG